MKREFEYDDSAIPRFRDSAILATLLTLGIAMGDLLPIARAQGSEVLPELPGPGLELPVDVDGDGKSTWADLYLFNHWLSQRGTLAEALEVATVNGRVLDVSELFDQTGTAGSRASRPSTPLILEAGAGAGGSPTFPLPVVDMTTAPQPDVFDPRITPDGRFVVFSTARNLLNLLSFPAGVRQVYRLDLRFQCLLLVSRLDDGEPATSDCTRPSISNDGSRVAFETTTALVAGDGDGTLADIYAVAVNAATFSLSRLLVTADLVAGGIDGNASAACISGDGQFVAFTSTSATLDGFDITSIPDVFRAEFNINSFSVFNIEIVSVSNSGVQSTMLTGNPAGFSTVTTSDCPGGAMSVGRVISDDGRFVLFHGRPCDWCTSQPDLCPSTYIDLSPCIAANCTDCSTCIADPGCPASYAQQVYLRDLDQSMTHLAGGAFDIPNGNPPTGFDGFLPADACSRRASLSGDGARLAWSSFATNYRVHPADPLDGDAIEDVFVQALVNVPTFGAFNGSNPTNVTQIACGGCLLGASTEPRMSSDGTSVVYSSTVSNLVTGDSNGLQDVFLSDLNWPFESQAFVTATTRRNLQNGTGVEAAGGLSSDPELATPAGFGTIVSYASRATNLVSPDTNGAQDVFFSGTMPPLLATTFVRGDANSDGMVNISDSQFILDHLFLGGPAPACLDSADADDNGLLNLTDPIYLLAFLFQGSGLPPPWPFQAGTGLSGPLICGCDLTSDALTCAVSTSGCP